MYCMQVISLFHRAESSSFCNSYYLFTLSFLSKQTRHGRNIVSFCFFLFACGRAKCLSRQQCVGSECKSRRLVLEQQSAEVSQLWPAALYEAGLWVLMLVKGSKIARVELSTVHLYQHYPLFMHNELQYTWRGDYCKCVRPAQVPVLNEVRAPSFLEQHRR
jgi:hypothetical protein